MRKIIIILCAIIPLGLLGGLVKKTDHFYPPQLLSVFGQTTPKVTELAPSAASAILMDAKTGKVLYSKNADRSMLIASTTKIMTAILAVEHGKLNEQITIHPSSVGVEGSSIYLQPGESITLTTLLYGLMLRSGNDAATAIAEHVGGSEEGFVVLMNQKAEALGLTHTHYTNPSGLDHPEHYSSARDLATLTRYALKNPAFREIVKTKKIRFPRGEDQIFLFNNKNKLLKMYQWADGIKTGFTKKAQRSLVGSASKDGHQLITVTLRDSRNDWSEHMQMFEYGFKQLSMGQQE